MPKDFMTDQKILYRGLYEWLMKAIDEGQYAYEEKLPSETMLCNKFGVSRQTVRNAMDELSRRGYIAREKGRGTFVKRQINLERSRTIGVCLSFLDNYIFPHVLEGIERVLTREGYGIDLGFGHNRVENEAKFLRRMTESNVSGLIVEGIKSTFPSPNDHYYKKLLRAGVPVVMVHNYYSNVECPSVLMEDEKLTKEITQMLIKAGHRKIGGLFKFDDAQGPKRYLGYLRAMTESGVPVREEYIRWYDSTEMMEAASRNSDKYRRFAELIAGECSAFVCYNDLVACAVTQHLRALGVLVPEQMSVAGFDDSEIMHSYDIGLTSVHHPKAKMGERAAEVLLEYIRNPRKKVGERVLHIVPSVVTVRDSIRPISR